MNAKTDKLVFSDRLIFIRNIIILLIAALITLAIVNRNGAYPWGSDTFGHLFKSNILYDGFKQGKFFVNYNESWYNGVQPYRYWAPLPYYILAVVNLATNNIFTTFNIFIVFAFMLGGLGWLCWGYYLKRQNLLLVLAILWFFVPINLKILFSEGNIPYVIVNSLIPFAFLYYYKTIYDNKTSNYIFLAVFMSVITLSHAMLAAMVGVSLFILAAVDSIINRRYFKNLFSLVYVFLGIMLTSFWFYPALKGGIMSIDKAAVADVMKSLTYPLSISLNPMLRFSNIEIYYYGLAFAFAALFGLLFSTRNEKAYFTAALIILFGTTKIALSILEKLPMNQLFWMRRFTSISMAMIFIALIIWKKLRKSVLWVLVSLLVIDSAFSFYLLGFNRKYPSDMSKTLDNATKIAAQRVGMLDSSEFGSFPSYYITYNHSGRAANQVYGWAWQGASTAKNIVLINTALENGYYGLMFDRALELGSDVLVVKKSFIKDYKKLQEAASTVGYKKYQEDSRTIIYKYPTAGSFATKVNYDGIAIGSYSPNALYIFPKLRVGDSEYLDDYSYSELRKDKVVYLSGFKYRNKKNAEALALKLSRRGVRVVIDVTGLEESFLGVTAEPVSIKDNYQNIYYKNKRLKTEKFPNEYRDWSTYFLNGVKNKKSYDVENHKIIKYLGKKDNRNLTFIGLNLPYYAFLTKDEGVVKILEDVLSMKAYEIPKRVLHKIEVKRKDNMLNIKSDSTNVIVPVAALDAFVKVRGNYSVKDNLIYLKTEQVKIKIIYPYLGIGTILSIIFLIFMIILSIMIKKKIINCKGVDMCEI